MKSKELIILGVGLVLVSAPSVVKGVRRKITLIKLEKLKRKCEKLMMIIAPAVIEDQKKEIESLKNEIKSLNENPKKK